MGAMFTQVVVRIILCLSIPFTILGIEPASAQQSSSVPTIIEEIGRLEQDKDPKCNATANRLEDFMYGTPLAFEARLEKITLQKALVLETWKKASSAARKQGKDRITPADIRPMLQRVLPHIETPQGDWEVASPSGERTR